MNEKIKKYMWVWLPLAILAVSATIVAVWLTVAPGGSLGVFAPDITPTKLSSDGSLIEPDTAFTLGNCEGKTELELRQHLEILPDMGYGLRLDTTATPPVWVLTPAKAFAPDADVAIKFGLHTTSYKVAPHIVVSGNYPKNGSTGVAVGSGIELAFNVEELTEAMVKPAITVTPPLDFYVGWNTGSASIYPQESMKYDTEYTFTLSADKFTHPTGYKLREDYTISFRTITELGERMERLISIEGGDTYNTQTTTPPMLELYFDEVVYNFNAQPKLKVNLYSYPDADSYKRAIAENNANSKRGKGDSGHFAPTTEGLTSYASFESEPFRLDESGRYGRTSSMVPFPDTLPEGRYLAELCYDTGENYTVKRYKLIQSSDMSVYFVQTGDSMVVWTNDATTGNPAVGASFTLEGDASCPTVTTGPDGVATITRASLGELNWGATAIINLEWQGHTFIDSSSFSGSSPNDTPQLQYTTTLFTDRPLYQSTDTVKVWGMLRPRRDGTPTPQKLTLEMDGIDPVPVTLNDKGFFTAELSLDNFAAGYGWLQLMVDDKAITTDVLRIYNYIKPTYTATIEPAQQFYMMSDLESIKVNVNLSSFDGTPIPVWKGVVEQEWGQRDIQFGGNGSITTDDAGNATVSVTAINEASSNHWYPVRYGITLRNRDAESENFLASSYLNIIPCDLMLEGSMKANGGTATVTVNTNKVDLTRANVAALTEDDYSYTNDLQELMRGDAVSTKITAKLYSATYVKTQSGTSYDYINRVSVPSYNYERVEKVEQEIVVTTDARGVATIPNLPCIAEDKTYWLELNAVDSTGRPVQNTLYLSMNEQSFRDGDLYYYSLRKVIDPAKILAENDGNYVFNEYQYLSTFTDNETVTFRLSNNGVPVDQMKGRILWTTVQTGFENLTVTDKDMVSLPFSEDLLPNYALTGAYFDGKNVFQLQVTRMGFDAESRRLDIALDTDSDEYHPGDKVNIDATVTEQATGKPAANAELVVAVVDEAIFAIQNQYVEPLEDIYQHVFYPVFTQYTSNDGYSPDGGGEKGGGGGETPVREKFPDTALWATATTDKDGKAKLNLTLPDSITSWRVTSLAVTDNNYAGNNKYNFVATKEFFVTPSVSNELLVGDSFTVGLRGAGKGVATDDPVSYTVAIQGASGVAPQTVTTKGIREYGWATFEGLAAGDYTVTVTGSCKDYTDGVKLPFTVLTSGVEMQRYKTVDLANGLKVDSLRFPVDITMYSPAYEMYNKVLWAARSQSYGSRADMQIGLAVTDKLLADSSGNSSQYISNPDAIASLTGSGAALKLFPHDTNPDMRLDALGHLAAADVLGYANNGYDGTSNPTTAWELAAPGAFYIRKADLGLYDNGSEVGFDSMSLVDKLDVGIAHVIGGDSNWALKLYDTEVTPRLQKLTGVSGETVYFMPEVGGKSSYDCTAAALRLATVLHHPDTDGLMRYLLERPSTRDPYIMEKLLYLSRFEPAANNLTSTVSYTLDGKRKTADLAANGTVSLSLSRNQLASLDVKVDTGKATASVRYTDEPDTSAIADKQLKITKTIVPADGGDSYKVGDLVKITLTPDLRGIATGIGDGELFVDDYLPSGMKFDRYEPNYIRNTAYWYMVSREGQRVRFSTSLDQGRLVPIVYYARSATPGKYVVEGTLITSGAGSTWGSSERATLTITP